MPGLICGGMENVIIRCLEWWWHSEQLSTALLLVRKKAKLCLAAATVRGLIVQLITSQKIQVGICDRNIYW